MTVRVLAALPLLFALVGCVEDSRQGMLVPPGEPMRTTSLRAKLNGPRLPEHEASVRRLLSVRGKLIAANPQVGLRPGVVAVGLSHPEITHAGGGTVGHQIVVSDGMIAACKTDDELAAVLAIELGKIVAERAESKSESRLPPDPNLVSGSDAGTFGPPDGTRQMELARHASKRATATASPEELARGYLSKAGYDAGAASAVAPLLRKAESRAELDKVVTSAQIGAPVRPAPTPIAPK